MKTFLTILWVIIIGATIFIATILFKPKTSQEKNTQLNDVSVSITSTTNTSSTSSTSTSTISTKPIENTPYELSENYTDYLAEANQHLLDKDYKKAIDALTEALKKNPKSTELLLKLGDTYLKANKPSHAEETFKTILTIKPKSQDAEIGIVRAYINKRNFEGAKSILSKINPEDEGTKYYTAIIHIIGNDPEGTKKILEEMKDTSKKYKKEVQNILNSYEIYYTYKDSDPIFLKLLIAKALIQNNEENATIPILLKIAEEKNNYRDAWISLGYAYLKTGKTQDAIDSLEEAKMQDQENPTTYFYLGLAYFANDDATRARKYLEKAESYDFKPKSLIELKLAEVYLFKKQYEKSAEKYIELINSNPEEINLYTRTIWLEIEKLNNPEEALKIAKLALKNFPDSAMSYNLVGWAMTANKDYTKGKEFLKKALEIQPNFDAATLNLGWLYEKQNDIKTAKEYYLETIKLGKGNSISVLAKERYNKLN